MIESAHIMTEAELSSFFSSLRNRNANQKSRASTQLQAQKEAIINSYFQYEDEQIEIEKAEKTELLTTVSLWRRKVCKCGSKLKLVNSPYSDFWGCTNYRDTTIQHSTFDTEFEEQISERFANKRVRIDHNWATHLLRKTNLANIASATDLLNYLSDLGYSDLRVKYGYKTSKESISGYVTARKESSREEIEIRDFLQNFFPKCKYQTGIKYKKVGEPEKVAIVDLILSNNDYVFVVEIKRHYYDIDNTQIERYNSLISFILKQAGDNRICIPVIIVFNETVVYQPPKLSYILYNDLRSYNNQIAVIRHLVDKAYDSK